MLNYLSYHGGLLWIKENGITMSLKHKMILTSKNFGIPERFKVRKVIGGNISETEDDFRAVDTVASLSLPRDRKSDGENWYMTYDVKFEFLIQSDVSILAEN